MWSVLKKFRCLYFLSLYSAYLQVAVPATAAYKNPKDYPIRLTFLSTAPVATGQSVSQNDTSCKPVDGSAEVNCTSQQRSGGTQYTYISTVQTPDGNMYDVVCRLGGGRRFLAGMGQGMAAQTGATTYRGCNIAPGTYQARSEGSRFMLLMQNGKETAFDVVASRAAPVTPPAKSQTVPPPTINPPTEKQSLEVSSVSITSTPDGADIEVDGTFVGNTPSTVHLSQGEHVLRVRKMGYKDWERKIASIGGVVNVSAVLESVAK